jgi:hypothetical protein
MEGALRIYAYYIKFLTFFPYLKYKSTLNEITLLSTCLGICACACVCVCACAGSYGTFWDVIPCSLVQASDTSKE